MLVKYNNILYICYFNSSQMKITTESFLEECRKVHGDLYDLSKVKYTRAKDRVVVGCPVHGDFEIEAYAFKKGSECQKCSFEKGYAKTRLGLNTFIERAKKAHGDYYSYELIKEIKNQTELVEIICPVHGVFEQKACDHTIGKGCIKCSFVRAGKKRRSTTEYFKKRAAKIHKGFYDYSKSVYKTDREKVIIICPTHGEFKQSPASHLSGSGCQKCGRYKSEKSKYLTQSEFEQKIKDIHGEKYKVTGTYTGTRDKIEITCKEHGIFKVIPNNAVSKMQGCPKCLPNASKSEIELNEFLEKYFKTLQNSRSIISPFELDIVIPKLKIAIEYNGVYFHSDKFLEDRYHLEKLEMCQDKGYKLIQVFEDEWTYKKDIVKSRLLNIIGKTPNVVYARKTEVREVSSKDSMKFLEENHLQGKLGAKVRLGLYHNDKLVSLMTFGSLRKNLGSKSKDGHFELLRFCNLLNTNVVGGASKLFKYFIRTYKPKEVISYADKRWSEGNLYKMLGFTEEHHSKPNYFYTNNGYTRESRFKYRKSELVKEGFDKSKTERQIMKEKGYNRIYDCGAIRFKYKTKTK